jgi:uncharacterized protein
MKTTEQIIEQTKKWITDVVIGCNFCPFAGKEIKQQTVHYQVENGTDKASCLQVFLKECTRLDEDENIVTTLLIFGDGFAQFDDFLDLLADAEDLLTANNYEGVYQVASFHPQYIFG